jgi:hypothetical protein
MLSASSADGIKLRELRGKGKPLSERFENNPSDESLALELKLIDHRIAECHQGIQGTRRKQK